MLKNTKKLKKYVEIGCAFANVETQAGKEEIVK